MLSANVDNDVSDIEDLYQDIRVDVSNIRLTSLSQENEAVLEVECNVELNFNFAALNSSSYINKEMVNAPHVSYTGTFEQEFVFEIEIHFDNPSNISQVYVNDVKSSEAIDDLSTYMLGDIKYIERHDEG